MSLNRSSLSRHTNSTRRSFWSRTSLTLLIAACINSTAFAQEPEIITPEGEPILRTEEDTKGIFAFSLENDYFAGEDNGYTNGFRLAYLSPEAHPPAIIRNIAHQLPFFAEEGHKRYSVAFGQSMYAPDNLGRVSLDPRDRPYAGFTYASIGMLTDTGFRLDNLQLTLGVVGPLSGAKHMQKFIHSAIDDQDPKGWGNQLKNEPGIILTYERKWRSIYEFSPLGFAVDATPHMGASIGNIDTYASTGVIFRFGKDLTADYGPPLIRPNLPGSDFFVPTKKLGWYLFTGFEGRAVARNIFLDGNTFTDSHSVDKKNFIGGLQAGIAMTYHNTRLAYTHIVRTKEFFGQSEGEEFGAVTLSYRF